MGEEEEMRALGEVDHGRCWALSTEVETGRDATQKCLEHLKFKKT